jgi:hypothetical protein
MSRRACIGVIGLPSATSINLGEPTASGRAACSRTGTISEPAQAVNECPAPAKRTARRSRFWSRLTFDMSGPEPDWPAKRNMNLRSFAGQAGGGPLDGRVRRHSANSESGVASAVVPSNSKTSRNRVDLTWPSTVDTRSRHSSGV